MHTSRSGSSRAFARMFLTLSVVAAIAPVANSVAAAAQESAGVVSSGMGAISGRVQNVVSGQYLNNARVTVKGTDTTAFTDESGVYRMTQLPGGPVVLEVFYSGLD